ncbi:radical SAM protein [Vibrio tubiashii]|uniref:Fe-S osidoreductase n=1 Tax=Vibrio tubiashii ATCC 19109 TaxID=1051646 RepID=F9T4F4_9VIBR|nr:radical SAM protein [Vibrio tubiashii]AIW13320.1 Fe-S osidoreductase [Vibrio tubiashii ATCC 19109]EGU56065.1 Fe-S oxidoreductase [Vibrio tubiashii ATCC 19109]EIF04456.1 radical SAM additional 4Fe4S-binding domain-containing protein [Vibrio tubiashii NCIMB 1337 = ATCC 19106]
MKYVWKSAQGIRGFDFERAKYVDFPTLGGALTEPERAKISLEFGEDWCELTPSDPWEGAMPLPMKAFINITKRCNFKCTHCFNDSGKRDAAEMDIATLNDLFDQLEALHIFHVTISGGEPLYHSEWSALIEALQHRQLSFSLVSNGALFNERIIAGLNALPYFRGVTVSLDGVDAATNDHVRGRGSFNQACQGLAQLSRHATFDVSLRTTLHTDNTSHIDRLIDVAAKFNIGHIKVNALNPYGRARHLMDKVLDNQDYLAIRQSLHDAGQLQNIRVEVPSQKYVAKEGLVGLCRSGQDSFEVDADGTVYPCSFTFGQLAQGNVHHQSLREIVGKMAGFTLDNPVCAGCKGRGGQQEKVLGAVSSLIERKQ